MNISSTIFLAGLLIVSIVYFWRKVRIMENISMSGEMNKIGKSINKFTQQYESEIEAIKKSQEEIKNEIKKVGRQDYKLTTEIKTNTEEAKRLNEQLSETQKLINDSLTAQLQEVKTLLNESMTLRQENGNLQRDIEKWQQFAVNFFENLERMLELQEEDTSKQTIEKVIQDFGKLVNPLGLERVAPLKGDDLNEELHQLIDEKESSDIEPGKVLECKKWAYKINSKLYQDKRAEVILAKASQKGEEVKEEDEKEESNLNNSTNPEQPEILPENSEEDTGNQTQSSSSEPEISPKNAPVKEEDEKEESNFNNPTNSEQLETPPENSEEDTGNQTEPSSSETGENDNNTSDSNS